MEPDKAWQELVKLYPSALNSYYGDEFGPVGKGWYPLVATAAKALDPVGGYFVQIKEKFGTLRLYYSADDALPEGTGDVVRQMEDLSTSFCELCGMHGELRGGGWMLTLCDACHAERKRAV